VTDYGYVQALGREWKWPVADVKCRAAVFGENKAVDLATKLTRHRRTAVQAGGNMGLFPYLLARRFDRVVTAEPDPRCFVCLDENVTAPNVEKLHAAFAHVAGTVDMEYLDADNFGSQRVVFGGAVPCVTIDSLQLTDCDLIYLDIEGAELLALRGAAETIASTKPVICVEDKGLSGPYGSAKGDIGRWLAQEFGYRQAATFKRDVMFACE
jgi:FkbM family methyltransferase